MEIDSAIFQGLESFGKGEVHLTKVFIEKCFY